jgi:hypothetical protein
MSKLLTSLRTRAGVRSLLSDVNSNPKVAKNSKKLGVLTAVMHLAPGDMSGHEVCPKRTPGCTAACLHFAGSPMYMAGKTRARIARTQLFFADRNLFMNILALEIAAHLHSAERKNMEAAVRLNGTSDIVWEKKKFIMFPEVREVLGRSAATIIDLFPTTSFYDYTAIPGRTPPANYDLTFSLKEQNESDAMREYNRGSNVAAVFFGALPLSFQLGGREVRVVDGDEHDYRPADDRSVIVGLKAKGLKGKRDLSGFVQLPYARTETHSVSVAA